jgi:transcriptional regulator with XRE-family HTH domain
MEYAQALRDIRDARSETQEELGRLLGWSAPVVSRFEAASERPDAATHGRYCALAPTSELRERISGAYRLLAPATQPKVPAGRLSNEEWQARALEGTGLYELLAERYPEYPTLKLLGDESSPLPVWAKVAPREQWLDTEAGLGELSVSLPMPQVRQWSTGEDYDPKAEADFRRHLDDWDRQVREVQTGRRAHLDKWNQLTYDLDRIERTDRGLKMHCKMGTYFHSLATSESLADEVMEVYSAWPDYRPEEGWPKLKRRTWLHERVADPVIDGGHRSSAIGVSTLTVVRVRRTSFDGYKMFVSPRSIRVATSRRRYHVIPSGMFQPFIADESGASMRSQFSVSATVLREFVEELYGVEELETGDGRIDPEAIYHRREAKLLTGMLESGAARLLYTGIAVNLLALRPEICTLLVIDDPDWFETESGEIRFCGEYLRQSERTDLLPDQRWVQLIELHGEDLEPEPGWRQHLRPGTLVAPGWAGAVLGLRVAREVIG